MCYINKYTSTSKVYQTDEAISEGMRISSNHWWKGLSNCHLRPVICMMSSTIHIADCTEVTHEWGTGPLQWQKLRLGTESHVRHSQTCTVAQQMQCGCMRALVFGGFCQKPVLNVCLIWRPTLQEETFRVVVLWPVKTCMMSIFDLWKMLRVRMKKGQSETKFRI